MAVVNDINKAIRKSGQKYMKPKRVDKISAPDNEIRIPPARDRLKRKSRCCLGTWYATVLPQKILLNIVIIEMFANTRAISPLPSLPHILVVNTTRAKLARRIINFVTIVLVVFLYNICSG